MTRRLRTALLAAAGVGVALSAPWLFRHAAALYVLLVLGLVALVARGLRDLLADAGREVDARMAPETLTLHCEPIDAFGVERMEKLAAEGWGDLTVDGWQRPTAADHADAALERGAR